MIKLLTKKRKGFTLIELIVVVAILGILAAIAIPSFTGTQAKANERANETNISTLQSAASLAVAEHGAPANAVAWTALGTGTTPHLASNYLTKWPAPPTGYKAYNVSIATTGIVTVTQP